MRSSDRSDVTLLAGFVIALLVTFRRPIYQFLQLGRQIEEEHGLALVPGLAILVTVLLGNHLMSRFHRATQRCLANEAKDALALSQALAQATNREAIRDVIAQQLPAVTRTDDAWVVMRESDQWKSLVGASPRDAARVAPNIEAVATRVADNPSDPSDDAQGQLVDGCLCFRIAVVDGVVVLGLPFGPEAGREGARFRLASVATAIGMALRNAQLQASIEGHGILDGLTGCFNRTHGMKMLDTELKRAKRARTALSVAMFDLDYFKSVNDQHGHLCGDALLTAVGNKLQEMLRNSDVKVRYGGEEFLILLPDTPLPGAIHVGDMLRQEIENVSIEWNGHTVATTASIGIAVARPGELDPMALVGRADDALYRAKRGGRNQVCVDGADDNAAVVAETPVPKAPATTESVAEPGDLPNNRGAVTTAAS